MYIKSLKLQNFRNYADESFAFDPAVNLICGENGQGKTNLLEAAAACSTMRLFRTAQKKEGLRFGENHAFIFADFVAQERDISLELRFSRAKAMEIYKNGVRQKRQSDTQGLLKTVLFCPEDLMLVRAGAAARRRFLDTALCQMRPNYARYLEEYNRLHEHKTRILRDSEEKPSLLSMWEDFSLRMAHIGAQIIRYRAYYCRKLLKAAAAVYADIAPHEVLSGVYKTVSSVTDPFADARTIEKQLIDHVFSHKTAEIAAKSCLPVRIRMTWSCYWMAAVPLPSARRDRCGPAHCRLNSPSVSCFSTRTASIRCCCSTTCSASLTAAVRTLCSTAYRRVRS